VEVISAIERDDLPEIEEDRDNWKQRQQESVGLQPDRPNGEPG
jgi:hypothetical protein